MIKRELPVFIVVGLVTVAIDFVCYVSLVWIGVGVAIAKALGFVAGTVFAYFANRFWTFGHRDVAAGSVPRFAILYAGTAVANVAVNGGLLKVLAYSSVAVICSFVVATGVSASLNFLGMKFFVYR
ncbi:GtrA family protein [Rhodopseudomonas telluris]|uniref:GtrA family protein n=1 Tax=Rhodopseudomonas telluris TaxID=644215 RepID=A0ABV6EPU1_9BRAD